ncbi:hypothetical protein [Veronia pacifica]|uniref:DUF1127 domain-containing protein n=1 Tax=Veronia pacifica TaxID=1080227 RepID=A0A1C3EGY0_9GAMM|nr:hypothetical protein [Veronia pacifica]ODA32473.1 hypothetical protein A8L45_12835 [Veronia pacifica]
MNIFLYAATALVRLDHYIEQRRHSREKVPVYFQLDGLTAHMMQDIGLRPDGGSNRPVPSADFSARREVSRLRRRLRLNLIT